MNVIVLDRKLDDPESRVRRRGEGAADRGEHTARAEAVECGHGPQRHVHGMSGDMRRTGAVRNAWPPTGRRFSSRAGPAPAPSAGRGQAKLGRSAGHLDWANLAF